MEPDEDVQLEKLTDSGLMIYQPRKGYRFSLDAVLLARFATVKPGFKIMDLGTGSGVIPLLLSTRLEDLEITGVEIQAHLADLARRSVALNNKTDKISVCQADFRELGREFNGLWDLVLSNPPYYKKTSGKISAGESQAIARHELKCELEDIVKVGARLLKPKGHLAIVHRPERLPELFGLLAKYKLTPTRLKPVHPNRQRAATMFLLEATKGSARNLSLLPPLFVYRETGCYSLEMQQIFAGCNMQDGVK
ncbi:tRNA1(Val) (adenine(37)-N6)-methyltransferase [Zhaonella formicivorans]|jgi:tRNA1(Val) A37 N6-methylase TrmN6|uniref:tRNA1(Val) (adenine(37)-N6)-methyltransferase n=1 Tax=Zhaonella formicivorans TaxID=2528593 RepID=UPI0010E8E9D1|nr:tRNA1(Val) (adenine(37)-N6)-methyltransferase [Zhaonella formicivorans]